MARVRGPRPSITHPEPGEIDLLDVLHALSDHTRMTIVRCLREQGERACGTFPVDVAPSTMSHHFRVLRESGLIRQRDDGNKRWTTLREDELEGRFPGLLGTVIAAYEQPPPEPEPTPTPNQAPGAEGALIAS
ncbi:MAG TPA: helix-turn-helix domain-containing protein [Actinocrinis sp.]|nr:helix-turn-helix domain-containing protein [Actinocrinis sp.]